MKIISVILLILLLSQGLFSDVKTEEDFIPEPVNQSPLLGALETIPKKQGIITSGIATALGLSFTINSSYNLINETANEPTGIEVQNQIIFTSFLFLTTAITTLILRYFILRE